jgi:hypothetical protein
MKRESTAWLGFNVEVELEFPVSRGMISGRKIQSGKFRGQHGVDVGLNLLLQLLARRSLKRREVGIAGMGNESTFRLRLDAVRESADDAFEFHGIGRDCSALCRGRTSIKDETLRASIHPKRMSLVMFFLAGDVSCDGGNI